MSHADDGRRLLLYAFKVRAAMIVRARYPDLVKHNATPDFPAIVGANSDLRNRYALLLADPRAARTAMKLDDETLVS